MEQEGLKTYIFHKRERLCSKKRIEKLFAGDSRTISAYPLRVVYSTSPITFNPSPFTLHPSPIQVLISVSKRHFRHAIDRNRTKRLIREAYRLNKDILTSQLQGQSIDLAFIWMSDELSDFTTVESKMKNILQRIAENCKSS